MAESEPEEKVQWILNASVWSEEYLYIGRRPYLIILLFATLLMGTMSAVANYVTLVRLIKSKVENITLLTMKSCACADILRVLMFLGFVCPAWFTGEAIYSASTCYVEGFVASWLEFALHTQLVFLLIQRYILAQKLTGYRVLRDRRRLCVAASWLMSGLLSAIPMIPSVGTYVYKRSLSYCIVDNRIVSLLCDITSLVLPAVLMIIMAAINGATNEKLMKKGVSSTQHNKYYTCTKDGEKQTYCCWSSNTKSKRKKSRRTSDAVSSAQTKSVDQDIEAGAGEVTLGVLSMMSLNSSMIGLETTFSQNAVSYNSAGWALAIFGLRTCGIWALFPGHQLSVAMTHFLAFCSSFTRALIILLVGRLARKYLHERGLLNDYTLTTSDYDQDKRYTHTDTNTSQSDNMAHSVSRKANKPGGIRRAGSSFFTGFTLFDKLTGRSTQNLRHQSQHSNLGAGDFWDNPPLEAARDADRYEAYTRVSPEMRSLRKKQKRSSKNCGKIEPNTSSAKFVWRNRAAAKESDGVVIYDRFLMERTSARDVVCLTPATDFDHVAEVYPHGERPHSIACRQGYVRYTAGGAGEVTDYAGVRGKTGREHLSEAEQTELRARSQSEKTLSRYDKGQMRYMSKPPPERLRASSYVFSKDKIEIMN